MRLPDFLIIGGMRCGSTTLANILKTQSSIYLPESKELHYFDQRSPQIKNIDQYGQCFIAATNSQLVGEATPDYFSTEGCMERIHTTIPDVKLILILRDPVKRAWSHYRFSVATMREIEPFDNALNLEQERLAHPIHEHDIYFSYLQRSRYIDHIEHYLSRFDRSRLHIVFLEELNKEPQQTLQPLFSYLGLQLTNSWQDAHRITNQASLVNVRNDDVLEQQKRHKLAINRFSAKMLNSRILKVLPQRSRDKLYRKVESVIDPVNNLSESTINRLNRYFKPYNQRLEDFLERELPW